MPGPLTLSLESGDFTCVIEGITLDPILNVLSLINLQKKLPMKIILSALYISSCSIIKNVPSQVSPNYFP